MNIGFFTPTSQEHFHSSWCCPASCAHTHRDVVLSCKHIHMYVNVLFSAYRWNTTVSHLAITFIINIIFSLTTIQILLSQLIVFEKTLKECDVASAGCKKCRCSWLLGRSVVSIYLLPSALALGSEWGIYSRHICMYVRTYVCTCPSRFRNVNQQRFRNAKENAKTFSTYFVHPVYAG